MFTIRWIRTTIIFTLILLALPGLAQSTGGGYDRMDGDFIKPSKREQPKRNFNITNKERLNIYSVRRSANPRAGTGMTYTTTSDGSATGKIDEDVASTNRSTSDATGNPENTQSGESGQDGKVAPDAESNSQTGIKTTEAMDVVEDADMESIQRPLAVSETQLVFCSKRLMEYHLDQNCPMLKNVNPTRLTYAEAKATRYTACTECSGSR